MLTLASLIVVVAGLKAASALFLPILVALFLSLLCIPPMNRLQELGVPSWLAITVVICGATLIVFLVSLVIASSISEFQGKIPHYRSRIDEMVNQVVAWLNARGFKVSRGELVGQGDTGELMNRATEAMQAVLTMLSNVLLVVLTMIFILFEANSFKTKMRHALGSESDLSDFDVMTERIRKYLAIKTWVSLATGLAAGLLCWGAGVDFPWLWALIAFLFNFVPNIGSIVAAVFPVLLALIDRGLGTALFVTTGYALINLVIGNMIEPRLMGQRLGLSTLVVFLSLLFWGWVWGPVGMLLSVPLTVILKIALEHSDDFRWVAVMLGPAPEAPPVNRQRTKPVVPDKS